MKAILVIDIPDDVFIDDCRIEFRVIENVMEMCVADGVKRLKPMPKRKEYQAIGNDYAVIKTVDYGYNKCLDEILGDKE